jgi:hypothetical protein
MSAQARYQGIPSLAGIISGCFIDAVGSCSCPVTLDVKCSIMFLFLVSRALTLGVNCKFYCSGNVFFCMGVLFQRQTANSSRRKVNKKERLPRH